MKKELAKKLEAEGLGKAWKPIGCSWALEVTITFKEWCNKEKLPQDKIARIVFNDWKNRVSHLSPNAKLW